MFTVKKIFLVLSVSLFTLFTAKAEKDILFSSSFDNFDFTAEKGVNPVSINQKKPFIPAQKCAGVNGKNAVLLQPRDAVIYNAKGNLPERNGSVAFWFAPQFDVPYSCAQDYLTISFSDLAVNIHQAKGKYHDGKLLLSVTTFGKNRKVVKSLQGRHDLPEGTLKKGIWHSIVVTWSPEEIVLYLDGKIMPLKANEKWLKQSRSIVKLPPGLSLQVTEKNWFSLNHQSRSADRIKEGVVYDELKVYSRTLSAEEIGKLYTPAAGK